jgi:hypothetical protein
MSPDTVVHWSGVASVAWSVASAVLNTVFWFHSPEEWVAWAEAHPRGSAAVRACRAYGIDPRKGLIALRDLAARHGRSPEQPLPVHPIVSSPAETVPPPVCLDSEVERPAPKKEEP